MNDVSTDTAPGEEVRRLEAVLADKIDAHRLAEWLRPLNLVCSRPLDREALQIRTMALLTLLGDFPAAAFTIHSARRVKSIGFPSAAAIRAAVTPTLKELQDSLERRRRVASPADSQRARSEASRWAQFYRDRMAGSHDDMPRADEAHLLSLLRSRTPAAYEIVVGAAREVIDDEADRAWWGDRIRARFERENDPSFIRNPTVRWREAAGMLGTLTRPGATIRQTIIDRVMGIMRLAEDEGAEMSEAVEAFPSPDPKRPGSIFGDAKDPFVPFSDRTATAEARAAGGASKADRPSATPLSREQLAAAYADIGTGPAQFRADQLRSTEHEP